MDRRGAGDLLGIGGPPPCPLTITGSSHRSGDASQRPRLLVRVGDGTGRTPPAISRFLGDFSKTSLGKLRAGLLAWRTGLELLLP
jgi:hypothetical protein